MPAFRVPKFEWDASLTGFTICQRLKVQGSEGLDKHDFDVSVTCLNRELFPPSDIHEEETAASSNTTEPSEKHDLNIFLGRWVLVDSQVSTPLVKVIRAEMVMTPLGDDEYTIQDTWTESVCWCYRRTYKNTSIGRATGPDSFIETNVKTGNVEYGRKVRVSIVYDVN